MASDPALLPIIYELPKEADWHDKSLWHMANPNLDIGLPTDLETEYKKAMAMPSYQNVFRMTKLNQICDSETVWLPLHDWDVNTKNEWRTDLHNYPCALGVDLSTSEDITSFVATWFVDDILYIDPYFFIPELNMATRERNHRVQYSNWLRDQETTNLYATPGNSVD